MNGRLPEGEHFLSARKQRMREKPGVARPWTAFYERCALLSQFRFYSTKEGIMEKTEERKQYEVPDMQDRLTAIGHTYFTLKTYQEWYGSRTSEGDPLLCTS